ncbi:MAG: Mo-dependent nitrogenase C-terminal domain-containing protein [Chamaesiphon sp.]
MNVSEYTISHLDLAKWEWIHKEETTTSNVMTSYSVDEKTLFEPLQPLRQWLDRIEVKDPYVAKRICELIPAQCPFERDVKLFGHTLFHIPPMCKLNPLYEEVVALRFRALCYLVDECGEDVSAYC